MKTMTDKEKIRAEIERQKKLISDTCQGVIVSQKNSIKYEVYKNLLSFIDSLEDPKDKCIGCNNVKGCITCVDGSEWAHYEEVKEYPQQSQVVLYGLDGRNPQEDEKEHTSDLEQEINNYIGHPQEADEDASITAIRQAARHFAFWQKQQMLKDAVDLVIEDASFVNLKIEGIKKNDKVKVIILKEK